jgi:hypothetical protein
VSPRRHPRDALAVPVPARLERAAGSALAAPAYRGKDCGVVRFHRQSTSAIPRHAVLRSVPSRFRPLTVDRPARASATRQTRRGGRRPGMSVVKGTMGRMSAAEESVKSLTCLELSGGAGGRALGLEQAGFIHRAVIERDPHACLTLQMNWPGQIVQADICEISGKDFPVIDLVSGGLSSPERADAEQQGGFPQVARLIHEIRPRAVLLDGSKKLLAKPRSTGPIGVLSGVST